MQVALTLGVERIPEPIIVAGNKLICMFTGFQADTDRIGAVGIRPFHGQLTAFPLRERPRHARILHRPVGGSNEKSQYIDRHRFPHTSK